MKNIKYCLLLFCLTYLVSCGKINVTNSAIENNAKFFNAKSSNLTEVAVPKIIQQLNLQLDKHIPQVKILSPRMGQTINQTNISVQLEVQNLPIFQDDKLKLGNHLNFILDNESSKPIYNLDEEIALDNLTPGTHTIRVFATRPWGESFKNDGAYAQTTFNVLAETNDNRPDRNLPLLTYGNPTGTYSAEPFLLDFYLTNAPLHSVAQNDPNLSDWKIKTTVNGDSFFLENWQPVYLTGLNKGKNWIQLELLDEQGNNIENAFNNTVRVINYDPQETDSLGKLFTDKLTLAEAQPIIEQTYYIQPVGEPEIIEPTTEVDEVGEPEAIEPVLEPTEKEEDITILEPDNSTETVTAEESELTTSKVLTQPEINPIEKDTITEETVEIVQDTEIVKPEKIILETEDSTIELNVKEPENAIANSKDNLDLDKSITTNETSEPESIEVSEETIDTTIPNIESNNTDAIEPQLTSEEPTWFKKLLVSLRQKLESLVQLLPRES